MTAVAGEFPRALGAAAAHSSIDHILVSQALKERVRACSIDKLPRTNERPSDHAPVLVEIAN